MKPIPSYKLATDPRYLHGLEAASKGDIATASDQLRLLVHKHPHRLPAIITPLTQLCIQSENPIPLQFLIADLFSICGYYTEAVQELDEIIEADPKNSNAYQLLGRIWSRAPGQHDIQTIFENAILNDIFDSAVLDILPKMYLGQFDYEKSVNLYQKLVNRDPAAIHLRSSLANLLTKCDRIAEAIAEFETIVKLSPFHASDVANRLDEVVKIAPDNVALRKALFQINCKICQPDVAVNHLICLIEWHPSEAAAAAELLADASDLFPDSTTIWLALARALTLTQQYSQSVMYLQKIFEMPEKSNLREVIELTQEILQLFPAQVYAMQLLADIFSHQGNFTIALDYLDAMTQFDLQDIESVQNRLSTISKSQSDLIYRCHYIRAKLYLNQRQYDKTIEECRFVHGSDFEVLGQQLSAYAHQYKGDLHNSESALQSALHLAPFNPELHAQLSGLKAKYTESFSSRNADPDQSYLNLGTAYLIQSDYFLALEHLQKIPQDSPDFTLGQLIIARCFLDLGRYDQSLNHLNRLLANASLDPFFLNQVRYLISTNHFFLGDIIKCIDTIESILENDITFGNGQQLIKHLKQESVLAYRTKAVSGIINADQHFIICAVKNVDGNASQTISFAHPHNNSGVDYLFKHQFKAAEDEFQLALQMDPNLAIVYCNFAILKIIHRQFDEAASLIRRAESISPHFDLCHQIRGLIAMYENRIVEAEHEFQSAYSLNANNYVTVINLGDIYYRQKELQPAFEFWKNATEVAPIPHIARRRLGYLTPIANYWDHWKGHFETQIQYPTPNQ